MIDSKIKVNINGLKQRIHIKGNPDKNILLFLHGGPGVANRHIPCKYNDDLADDFLVVGYDQRGTGGSYWGSKKEDFKIEQYVEDVECLIKYLCKEFNKEKVFTIGGSWGSLLGLRHAYKYPEHLYAFLGFGQFVDGELNEEISYNFALEEAKKHNDVKSIAKLEKIGKPIKGLYKDGYKGMSIQREIMNKYGGYSKKHQSKSYTGGLAKAYLYSGEYSFCDALGVLFGAKRTVITMWPEIAKIKLEKDYLKYDCPILIFDGKLDKNTPADLVEDYYDAIKAPYKELIWFEQSGHNPLIDEADRFKELLKDCFHKIERGELCQ